MGFLLKLGQIILKGAQIVSGISPIIQTVYPGSSQAVQVVSQDFAQVADIIQQVEVMGQVLGQPGSEKLKAATPLVAQVVLKSAVLVNHSINDPVLFQAGCTKLADGWADILNSLKDSGIQTTNKA